MNVLLISYEKIPSDSAGVTRAFVFAKMIKSLGHNVALIGTGNIPYLQPTIHDGVQCISLRRPGESFRSRFQNYLMFTGRLKRCLKRISDNHHIDLVFVLNVPLSSTIMVKALAEKEQFRLVHDSTEWYSPSQFICGRLSYSYLSKDLLNRFFIDRHFSVIAISRFLEEHFLGRDIRTVRIPVIFDVHNMPFKKEISRGKVVFTYAGSPGKKDYIAQIIEAFSLLDEDELSSTELRLIGANWRDISFLFKTREAILEKVKSSLNVMGHIPRQVVLENLGQSDFSVLLRPSELRYSKAGFPTKVVESLALGIPVITNITSDLGEHIFDMKNGIIVDSCSPNALCEALRKALRLTDDKRLSMKKCARQSAENSFDSENYIEVMKSILCDDYD